MKVLHLNITDYGYGGTGVAMHRLHLAMRRAEIDSKILCRKKRLDSSEHISLVNPSKSVKIAETLLNSVTSKLGLNNIHGLSAFGVKKHPAYLEADVVNLHCLHGGFFSYLALPELTQSKPTVLVLHDMWPFTGHCTYSLDCERWKTGCGKCPYPKTSDAIERDSTHIEWKLKNWVYGRSKLTLICPSRWIAEQAQQSMLNRFPIHHIPHGVDVETFQPLDREQCRSMLGITPGKKVLMFAAVQLNEQRKGGDLLVKALRDLPESLKSETELLLLGEGSGKVAQAAGIPAISLGYLKNTRMMAIAYAAADLFLCPTRAEVLGLVILESMACGTPVVAFNVGGVPDLVRPNLTGYLAKPEDATDFRDGIVQLLEADAQRAQLRQHCRAIVLAEYTLELQIQRYLELYTQLLSGQTPAELPSQTPAQPLAGLPAS